MPSLVSAHSGIIRALEPMAADLRSPPLPRAFRATLANHQLVPPGTVDVGAWGKGMSERDAVASAVGEAVERYSAHDFGQLPSTLGRHRDLREPALDPRRLVLHRPEQYAELAIRPYSEDAVLGWVKARSLVSDRVVLVPAQAVYLSYFAESPEEYLFSANSNGLAGHETLAGAVWAGLREVLERDAFMIAWLSRLPCASVRAADHPDPLVRQIHESYARRGVELVLYRLPTDHPCSAVAAFLVDRSGAGPAVVGGLGAELDPVTAARLAALEAAQIRPSLSHALHLPRNRKHAAWLAADPRRVRTLLDHSLLFADPRSLLSLRFLSRGRPLHQEVRPARAATDAEKLELFARFFRARGDDILYVEVTPPEIATLGLHVVRVIVPDFQPIDFGWRERRLAGDRLHRLPVALGFRRARRASPPLNAYPHPMA